MRRLKTALAFAKNVRTTGALYETSRKVELEITSKITAAPEQVFVEFGLGHGNITQEILNHISPTSRLYSFEVKEEFCAHVAENIQDPRLHILNHSAAELAKHVPGPVDGIVSSLPLTLFPTELREQILTGAYAHLRPGAHFSQVMYSKRLLKKFHQLFDGVEVKRFVSIPFEFIFHCRKE
ncbi:MAG: methyltransferase domain-containing protein [Bacteroidota bacterium]